MGLEPTNSGLGNRAPILSRNTPKISPVRGVNLVHRLTHRLTLGNLRRLYVPIVLAFKLGHETGSPGQNRTVVAGLEDQSLIR